MMQKKSEDRQSIHGQWSSRWAFIMAATGSAVGLGNIWRFPYIAGESGGGAFVLVYIACVLLFGIPIMMCEILLGRRGRQNPTDTMASLAKDEGLSANWHYLGWMGIVAGFLILSFYSVLAGWVLEYIWWTGSGRLSMVSGAEIDGLFEGLLASPLRLLLLHTVFMLMTIAVTMRGVKYGLERATLALMPCLFVLLLLMAAYAMTTDGFAEGVRYLLYPEWQQISGGMLVAALGQAFFSLSLGMGAIMIYGSYLSADTSVMKVACSIAAVDTLVAIVAGLVIFPLVFTYQLEPSAGPSLIFETLPRAFAVMPYGQVVALMFFVLLLFAALSSAISLLEPAVTWLIERRGLDRVVASIVAGIVAWLLGIGSLLSFNVWQEYKLFDKTYFELVDYVTSNIILPVGGLLIVVFTAWFMSKKSVAEELQLGDGLLLRCWQLTVSYVAPIGVVAVFLHALGLFG